MITVYAPLKRSEFQTINFGTLTFNGYDETGAPLTKNTPIIDEILIANSIENDPNQIDFIKRYNTWFVFTSMENFPVLPYSIIFIHYDRIARIAYTANDSLKIVRRV